MKLTKARIFQIISILVLQGIVLYAIQAFLPGLLITSFWSAVIAALGYSIAQAVFWYVFIEFFSWLSSIFYPILTFILSGAAVYLVYNLAPGITVTSWVTGLWITIWMTIANAILGELLSLDEDNVFDRRVTRRIVKKLSETFQSDVPGFLFLEIDGLGVKKLHEAIAEGYMPNLKRWLDQRTHRITGWETDFSSQTGAMQSGILLGNNNEIPAYRWWDRINKRIVISGDPRDALALEKKLSNGRGLLSNGGASRGNMFSGDAAESLITMSTALDRSRKRGPGFYFYLLSPYILARLVSRFSVECIKEWWQAWQQKRRKDPYRISARKPAYAFLRGFLGPIMQDLSTYMVISDILRGVPAIYALYSGYDDLSHFAGIHSPEALESLYETDHYISRIEKAIDRAPRPYRIIVLSDHGQTLGMTFENTHGITLEDLVDALIKGKGDVYVTQKTHETWDKLSILLTESIKDDTRTAKFIRSMLVNRERDGRIEVGPKAEDEKARSKEAIVVASGCAGLIYFSHGEERLTSEQINQAYPDLLVGLVNHPGIGFVMVKSEIQGNMAIGKKGIHFLDDDKVEGEDPLFPYGPNAARHLNRQAGFVSCPDLLVNSAFNIQTQEMCGFENQVSHHGGMGGPQNQAFVLHPVELTAGEQPIITAVGLYHTLHGWCEQVQGTAE